MPHSLSNNAAPALGDSFSASASGTCPGTPALQGNRGQFAGAAPLLELHGVSKSFEQREVIRSASLVLLPGEVLCLSGASGIGKSTLLEIMAGVTRPDQGFVSRRAEAALMFQDDALLPWLNALNNVTYILPATLPGPEAAALARRWLRRFGLEDELYPAAMSGGMRRRLSLARTFAAGRSIILLDEPFAFLDDEWQEVIAQEITGLAQSGTALAITSHHRAPFARVCGREIAIETSPIVIKPEEL